MDRPDIAIFLDSRQLGGIETHVFHLARGLQTFGMKPIILFFNRYHRDHPIQSLLSANHLPFHYLDGNPLAIYHWLKRHQPLVLHTHGYKAGVTGRLSGWFSKTPVASTFHNGDRGEGLVRFYTLLDQITCRLSDNIAVSPDIAARLSGSVTLMNNFVEAPSGSRASERSSKPEIAFVGRLSHEKGPDLFLQLAKHQPDLSFRAYGNGPMLDRLTAVKTTNIDFAGQVSNMDQHWRDIDLLCITSRQEGLPLVALEAMAHGIPVLSFAVGAVPQLIKQGVNGWIIPEGHIKQMSEQLEQWHQLSSVRKRTMMKQCIQTVRDHYSYDAVIPRVLAFYQKTVMDKGVIWPYKTRHRDKNGMINHPL